jgi:hypothetical protein
MIPAVGFASIARTSRTRVGPIMMLSASSTIM